MYHSEFANCFVSHAVSTWVLFDKPRRLNELAFWSVAWKKKNIPPEEPKMETVEGKVLVLGT